MLFIDIFFKLAIHSYMLSIKSSASIDSEVREPLDEAEVARDRLLARIGGDAVSRTSTLCAIDEADVRVDEADLRCEEPVVEGREVSTLELSVCSILRFRFRT